MLLCLLVAAPAATQTFPAFTDYVVDQANVLPPATEAELVGKLAALQRDTGRQLVVATIPDLQGYTIEDYGYRLGRHWGVGRKNADDGAILIVAPNARKVRIEVGYGLTPYITDTLSSVIISTRILPPFKAGDLPAGIVAGTDALVEQLRLPEAQAHDRATRAATPARQGTDFPVAGIFVLILVAIMILAMLRRRAGVGRRYRRGPAPVILWGPSLGGGWGGGGGFGGGGFGGWGGGSGSGGGFSGGGGGSFGGGGASGGW
jgi:uncharacterized protein